MSSSATFKVKQSTACCGVWALVVWICTGGIVQQAGPGWSVWVAPWGLEGFFNGSWLLFGNHSTLQGSCCCALVFFALFAAWAGVWR